MNVSNSTSIYQTSVMNEDYEDREMFLGPYGTTLDGDWHRFEIPDAEAKLERTDIYGNNHWRSGNLVEVVPECEDFEGYIEAFAIFANNFYTLSDNGISVPDFEGGVLTKEEGLRPYFLMYNPDGEPAGQSIDDELAEKLSEANNKGQSLAKKMRYFMMVLFAR